MSHRCGGQRGAAVLTNADVGALPAPAFPAIFPASATLIEKHEKEAKQAKGLHGTLRARSAAAIDAAGSSIGSIGLLGFALLVAALLPYHSPVAVLLLGLIAWAVVSAICWRLRKAM